jgi:hypothetical protein
MFEEVQAKLRARAVRLAESHTAPRGAAASSPAAAAAAAQGHQLDVIVEEFNTIHTEPSVRRARVTHAQVCMLALEPAMLWGCCTNALDAATGSHARSRGTRVRWAAG